MKYTKFANEKIKRLEILANLYASLNKDHSELKTNGVAFDSPIEKIQNERKEEVWSHVKKAIEDTEEIE